MHLCIVRTSKILKPFCVFRINFFSVCIEHAPSLCIIFGCFCVCYTREIAVHVLGLFSTLVTSSSTYLCTWSLMVSEWISPQWMSAWNLQCKLQWSSERLKYLTRSQPRIQMKLLKTDIEHYSISECFVAWSDVILLVK